MRPSALNHISMSRVALNTLALTLVLPTLVVFYLFRDQLEGKEAALLFVFVAALLGFSLVWNIVRTISTLHGRLDAVARGDSESLQLEVGPAQLREMTDVIDSLNRLTIEFRETGAQLQNFVQQFTALAELSELTAKVPDIDSLLRLVLEKATAAANARRGSVMLLRDTGAILDVVAVAGWNDEATGPIFLRDSLVREAIESGEPLLIEDIETAPGVMRGNNRSRYRSPSALIMPLRTKTSVVGAVCLSEKTTGAPFNGYDRKFLTVLLGQVGLAIENAKLLKQARAAADGLKETVEHQAGQIREAQRRALQAEKLSALGQLAGGVAHDFNNLVQGILGYTKMAQEGLPPDDQRYSDLERVRESAERAATLTSQLLAFGRRQLLQPADLDLNEIVAELATILEHMVGEHIEFERVQSPDLGVIHADRRQLEQILMNLCVNARDAMPEGGRITIETRNVVFGEEYCESRPWASPGRYVCLTVSDTGCGMDENTLNQIFEPFFTTNELKGTGLGLSTVYGIVKQHGALIDVSSKLGGGTVFRISFPIVDRPAETQESATAVVLRGGSETILVAEDEDTIRSLNTRILERAGYKVLSARDGEEAVTVFQANADEISLVLIDAVMPKLSGREVYKRIRSISPQVRVLFNSGYTDGFHTDFIPREGLQILQKPFRSEDLLHKVRETLEAQRAG